MNGPLNARPRRSPARFAAAALAAASLILTATSTTTRADLVVTAQSVTAAAGSSGNALDITLTNTGPSSVGIGGFFVEVSVASGSGVTFTGANTSTSPSSYIFGANSLFGPNIGTVGSGGLSVLAFDISSVINSGATLASGTTVGLAHVLFDVSSAAAGPVTVAITPYPTTNLSDFTGNNVAINTLTNGSITITSSSVPEPSVMTLAGVGLLGVVGVARLRRRCQSTTA